MTRRTLYIIIAMLAIIDLVAGLYYLGARLENEGRSLELFGKSDTVTVQADTTDVYILPDEIAPMRLRERAYTSSGDSTQRHLTCGMVVKWQRVNAVAGNDSLINLERAIAMTAFGKNERNLDAAIRAFLDEPYWGGNYVPDFTQVDFAMMRKAHRFNIITTVTIAPCMTSRRLLVVESRRDVATVFDTVTTTAYVHYDRLLQRVLQPNDIVRAGCEQQLLSLINDKITVLNRNKSLHLTQASRVPNSFRAMRQGLLFCFAEGELTDAEHGGIDVRVDYKVLGDCLTESFKHLLWNNSDYRAL